MSMEQETLIYVEENDKSEARVLAQSFAEKKTKSRAFINALGAELGMKYLALESINNSKTYNLHSVHKILEAFDISDIMLSNIHIDVRVIFDDNYIFVPKSHFKYDIVPDVYLVLHLSEDYSHAVFLGFFEPKLINKNNQNGDYYFIEKEKLTPPASLKSFIESFKGNTTQSLSESENEKAEMLMLSMADHNISENETKELLKYLTKSADLRDKFIEFENFELLAYKAESSPDVKMPQPKVSEEVPDTTIEDLSGSGLPETAEIAEEETLSELGLDEMTDAEISEAVMDGLDIDNPALDIAEGLGEAVSDAADLAAGAGLAAGAEALEGVQDVLETVDNVGGILESAEEMLSEDTADISTDLEQVADNLGDLPSPDENLIGAVEEDFAVSELPELESAETEIKSENIPMADEHDITQPSAVDFSGMADMDQLTAAASAGNFDDASLDDLMADDDNNAGDLNNIEVLQEENARKKGLLDGLDDDALMESSLSVSKDDILANTVVEDVNVSGFDAIAPEVRLEEASHSDEEEGVLDISDVNAVPNNLGENISETIELDNIVPVETTCENETNVKGTQPTMDINSAGAFEPLNTDDLFLDDSFSADDIALNADETAKTSAPSRPASPKDVDLSGFQSLDMESFEFVPMDERSQDESIPKEEEQVDLAEALLGDINVDSMGDLPDIGLSSNAIPDLDETDSEPAAIEHVDGSLAEQPPGEPEVLSFDNEIQQPDLNLQEEPLVDSSAEEVQNVEDLSVEDIVDAPEDTISDDAGLVVNDENIEIDETEETFTAEEETVESDEVVFETPISDDAEISSELQTEVPEAEVEEAAAAETSVDYSEQAEAVPAEEENEVVSARTSSPETLSGDNSDLTMLFNEAAENGIEGTMPAELIEEESFVPTLPHLPQKENAGNKIKIVGAAVIIALAVAGTFFGLTLKNKNQLAGSETVEQPAPENAELPPAPETPAVEENNTNIMANAPEVIDVPQNQAEPTNINPQKPANAQASSAKPVNPEGAVISVKKLSWQLPDYLSYSQEMKKYLQTAGRSIKLTLTSDLLLATEYAYSNQVKVALKLSNDGTIKDSKIVQSSGSSEIDKIVLQTVKETLNVVKPAPGEVSTPDFNLGLIINF